MKLQPIKEDNMEHIKLTFGDSSRQVHGDLCFPVDISSKQMTSNNYRRTEAVAHLRRYTKALKGQLKSTLPEGYELKWWPDGSPPRGEFSFNPHALSERYAIHRVVEGTPDSIDSDDYRKDWKAVQARWDAEALKIKHIVMEAHDAAVKEIGAPELHRPDGTPFPARENAQKQAEGHSAQVEQSRTKRGGPLTGWDLD
jgi:hypothetical protein